MLFIYFMLFATFVSVGYSEPWFYHIPNETMTGVPKELVQLEKYYPMIKDTIWSVFGRNGNSKNLVNRAAKIQLIQRESNESRSLEIFPCNISIGRSEAKPTSAHQLRPGDIDVIAALGDSLSAANGAFAFDLPYVYIENRGVSFSIGGQGNWKSHLTLPNIIKEFNPNLTGYSLGDSHTRNIQSRFNVAEPGAMTQDLPFMVRELVKRIRRDKNVDYKNDWKLVTILIGPNNFCLDICYHRQVEDNLRMHKKNLEETLKYLKKNMPRTLVNIVRAPNLRTLINMRTPSRCAFLQLFSCPCLLATQYKHKRKRYIEMMDEWGNLEMEIANEEQFKDKEDFAVLYQPFSTNITIPFSPPDSTTGIVYNDMSYMSADCFHLSQKGYATIANALWNNMMEPVGNKSTNWTPLYTKFLCPTERSPYIYTWKNSLNSQ